MGSYVGHVRPGIGHRRLRFEWAADAAVRLSCFRGGMTHTHAFLSDAQHHRLDSQNNVTRITRGHLAVVLRRPEVGGVMLMLPLILVAIAIGGFALLN